MLYLLLFLLVNKTLASNLIEDITMAEEEEDHITTFPTPPPIKTSTSPWRNDDSTQKFQIFNEKDIVSNPSPYGKHIKPQKKSSNRSDIKQRDNSNNQIVAGIPDLNDPCFRRYENSIIVNAQPYERRSSTGLIYCKSHCLNSQSGVYSCKSFVYDNINMICDLFSHVGDQSPARLLKFQTRDYYEPTNIVHCLKLINNPTDSDDKAADEEVIAPPSPPVVALASPNEEQKDDTTVAPIGDELVAVADKEQCVKGKMPTFLRTEGFELFKNDDEQMVVTDVGECTKACKTNMVNGKEMDCKSFDYLTSTSTCSFTSEAAVPVGNGQLKQRDDAFYHEKICVSKQFVESCPSSFFTRHPQMILVGFAESVSDSQSFEHCFDTCLNSYQLFGFNCTSGMYYFEESQLNCILNSENRMTQKELFTEENTDIVDYFEIECHRKHRMAGVRNFETDAIGADRMMMNQMGEGETEEDGSRWESWSECVDGKQTRRKSCTNFNKIEDCAEEVRDCFKSGNGLRMSIKKHEDKHEDDEVPTKEEIAQVKQKIRKEGFKCELNYCCKVFKSCSYGLRHNSHTKQLEWCRRSCTDDKRSRLLR